MFSPLFTEVKLRGMGQSFPGINPSGGPAFMYQATIQPVPAPLAPAPAPAPTPTPVSPMPTAVVPAQPGVVLPAAPTTVVVQAPDNTKYILAAIVVVALAGAFLIPGGK